MKIHWSTISLILTLSLAPQMVYSAPDSSQLASLPLPLLGMQISEEEQQAIKQSIMYARQISEKAEGKNGLPYRRDAHAKATGCLRATFSVNGDIPEHFQHSVFAQPSREYQTWIRFSNGDMLVQPDGKPDARGMAIKLMGVSGEKIAPELLGAATQDFVMTNTPAFFNRNIYDYVDDLSYLAKLERTRWFISFFPPRLHPRRFYRAIQTVSGKIRTPLQAQYYSMLPYQLGGTAVKFSTKACAGMRFDEQVDTSRVDYLTEAMQSKLQHQGACFDFMLQTQVPGSNMPLDDATVVWSEAASPFVPVARINIPPQSFTSEEQSQFCENLSMNPWHGVGEWQPLGSLNRARRLVYFTVSVYRHQQNAALQQEPSTWCLDDTNNCVLSDFLHVSKAKWPLPIKFDPLYQVQPDINATLSHDLAQ